jgi:hypothetical protein
MRSLCVAIWFAILLSAQQPFFYNRPGGLDPLTVGMKNDQPIAVDWDGDGRTDILSRNLYSRAYGEPWWGIYFFRNIGTQTKPRYATSIRLSLNNRPIEDFYASYQITDWNKDGHPDLLSGIGAGPRKNTLQVYLNQGKRDAQGVPILGSPTAIPVGSGGGELSYGMRFIDGDLYTLNMRVEYFPNQALEHRLYRHRRTTEGFGPAEPVRLNGSEVYEEWPSTKRDGKWIGNSRTRKGKLSSCIVEWPTDSSPPRCIADTTPDGFAVPTATKGGILAAYMGGWMRFYPNKAKPQLLLAENMPCSFGGYSSVEVADWEGDGDLDFIGGNETGFVQLIENISTKGHQQFLTARQIGVYAARWMFIDDEDPERPYGQTKPAYVDWDGDGDMDLLVGNNSNRVAYFENIGTRAKPRFAPHVKLVHDAGEHFSFRSRPAPVDYNNDGLLDLIAGSAGPRDRNNSKDIAISLYLRYRDTDGKLKLRAPQPLTDPTGKELRTPIPYHHGFEAKDWDGDGDIDLFTNERTQLVLYRNTGKGFQRELLMLEGKPISVSHHETSIKPVDWDGDGKLDLITGGESGWIYLFNRKAL